MNLDYLFENWREVLQLSVDHLELTMTSLLVALLIALPLSVFIDKFRRSELPLLGFLGTLYTVPSLALLAVLIPIVGLGTRPAIITLAIYAQVFLVRNMVTALQDVDSSTLEAARGLGMAGWQVFFRVHFPLALPVIVAGVRIALVAIINLATITAWVNAGGLGTLLFNGITRNNPSMILAGTVAVITLAITIDLLMRVLERQTAIARARRATV